MPKSENTVKIIVKITVKLNMKKKYIQDKYVYFKTKLFYR